MMPHRQDVMIEVCSQPEQAKAWLERYRGRSPVFACVLGFTETGLIPGISAAGATPTDRQYTALADAEFLYYGPQSCPTYPLPPLSAGASPVLITRSVVAAQQIPVYLFNAGLPHPLTVPCIDLGGMPARCLSHANAIDLPVAKHLFEQGLAWGERLVAQVPEGYVVLSECVVGGTTTALAVLTGLGWDAIGKVNSSHPTCNHQQKWQVVQSGLAQLASTSTPPSPDPLGLVAAIGDPMQVTVAGMTIAASRATGVLLAGGTQMLAVYALIQALSAAYRLDWRSEQVVVGTTRWVAKDPTGDTVGLARMLQAPLLASQLSFTTSQYTQLQAYEQGYVKEGVGAGGCAIVAALYKGWEQGQLLTTIETLLGEYEKVRSNKTTRTSEFNS
jgi:uncharacterized protein (TIGR00303 family)